MNINYIVGFCCLLLLLFLVFKEFERGKKNRLIFRLLASVFVVISLAFLWFPIKYKVNEKGNQNELILLTGGSKVATVSNSKSTIYTTDSLIIKEFKHKKVQYLADLPYHLAANQQINSIKIIGDGLSAEALEKLKTYQLAYQKPALPDGIQACNWDLELFTGQAFELQGKYQNSSSKAIKIILKGLGTSLDSVVVKPNTTLNFSFKSNPKQLGKAVYQLLALDKKDTLVVENIPFKVKNKQPLKFLILAATPDFEYKFLKNWLFENGYSVVFRSEISKDKFSFDFLNTPSVNIKQLSMQNLSSFDLVIADDAELANLSSSEKNVLQNQIEQGLGLIIRSTVAKSFSFFSKSFSFIDFPNQKEKSLALRYQNDNLSPLKTEQLFYLRSKVENQALVLDKSKHVLVDSKISGSGKVVLNAVSSTFQWVLHGENADYGKFWTGLINQSAKQKSVANQISLHPNFPTLRNKVTIRLDQLLPIPPFISVDGLTLNLVQNKALAFSWEGNYWPKKLGWNSLNINNQDSIDFYVYPIDAWQSSKRIAKMEGTDAFVKAQRNKKMIANYTLTQQEKEVSKWWFFFIFLIAAGYLWYGEKI